MVILSFGRSVLQPNFTQTTKEKTLGIRNKIEKFAEFGIKIKKICRIWNKNQKIRGIRNKIKQFAGFGIRVRNYNSKNARNLKILIKYARDLKLSLKYAWDFEL
jgi:nitrous oxidase accessory protein NosD